MSDSSGSRNNYPYYNSYYRPLNASVMTIAVATLFLVVFFILAIHIYAKWFWRRSFDGSNGVATNNGRSATPQSSTAAGLDKASVDLLPTFTYTESSAAHLRLSPECAVCLSEFQHNEKGRLLPACHHNFHTDCIDMWFCSHSTCPICRTEVKSANGTTAGSNEATATETRPSAEALENAVVVEVAAGSEAAAAPPESSHVIVIEATAERQMLDTAASGNSAGSEWNQSAEHAGSLQKSAGLRRSIKRMVSRQSSRVSEQQNAEAPPKDGPPPTV